MIKCINPKVYNLTAGKEYEVINESGRFYTVINDTGSAFSYSKELFEVETPAPIEEPLTIRIDNPAGNHQYRITTNKYAILRVIFERTGTSISCGINQFYNVNEVVREVLERYNEDAIEVLKALVSHVLTRYVYKFALLSTNITDNEDVVEVLDKVLGDHQHEGLNPNSGNDIALWVVDREQFV